MNEVVVGSHVFDRSERERERERERETHDDRERFAQPEVTFGKMTGVKETMVGYTGGKRPNPTYRSMGDHTESLKVTFDPRIVSYRDMVDKFFEQHTCSERTEGRSPQYINAIWYLNEKQHQIIEDKKSEIEKKGQKVNTRIAPAGNFYRAELYHQKYLEKRVRIVAGRLRVVISSRRPPYVRTYCFALTDDTV